MGSWGQTFRRWASGQYSPFGHPGQAQGAPVVQESDFSYITPKDLDKHHHTAPDNRPRRDTDTLTFRHKSNTYKAHFPAYSIDDGDLTVGEIRHEAAHSLRALDPRMIRLLYKGSNLKDDRARCCDVGLSSTGANDILCVVGDEPLVEPEYDSEDASDGSDDQTRSSDGTNKRKRNRRKRKTKKSSTQSSGTASPSVPTAEHLPIPSGSHPSQRNLEPNSASNTSTRQPSPAAPLTPMAKLLALSQKLREDLGPKAQAFMNHPPPEKAKKEFEHKKFTETILTQVLMKLDAVETEGDEEARALRKGLVKEAQDWLNRLDAIMKR